MNLGEALSSLKKEKSRLARLISLRKENVLIEKDKNSEFDPKEISKQIDKKIEDIRKLKINIQKANFSTKVAGEDISLAEAIIKVNDIRSKIAQLSSLFEKKHSSWCFDKDQKELVSQLKESDIEDEIEKLEGEKARLDNKIQMTNWSTALKEK
jgi:hypothetical protein